MTKWQEFPLRPQGRPWPGIATRQGRLGDGSGALEDTSTNCMINQADTLEKRKGLVRGLDEFFVGPVCGLHRYTDECGREFLLVADEDGISIRQPFEVPTFQLSDAFPFDSFESDGVPDPTRWRNREGYNQFGGELQNVAAAQPMTWFKEAATSSYQLRIQYRFLATPASQSIDLILKASSLGATFARIYLRLLFDGSSTSGFLFFRNAAGSDTQLLAFGLESTTEGTATVTYDKENLVAGVAVFPTLGTQVVQQAEPLTPVQDVDLGQFSAIQLTGTGQGVLVIDGGPLV